MTTAHTETTAAELTARVIARHSNVPDPRLKQIIIALVAHLHSFATEVGLTQEEWAAGIQFLTAAGHITNETLQEFILLSDTLGLSMLVDLIDHCADSGETESTVLGPFWVPDAPWRENGAVIARPQDGEPLYVFGRVTDLDGAPLAGAIVDVWQASGSGLYDVQDPDQPPGNLRGRFRTDADGRYDFWTVRPVPYPIPDDGPVGKMLAALGRHPWRAAHIHVRVSADGHEPVTTHVFDADSRYLDSDTVFGVKPTLIRKLSRYHGAVPDGLQAEINAPTYYLDFDLVVR
jgi:protocatechuate 3,4-dioxygenase beta subunit